MLSYRLKVSSPYSPENVLIPTKSENLKEPPPIQKGLSSQHRGAVHWWSANACGHAVAVPESRRGHILINLHGGGSVDASSLTESIPIANLTQTKVVAVLYRLLPEHRFPAQVDDSPSIQSC